MKKLILNNWPLKLLAILAAFVIWFVVTTINDPIITKTFEIPVEFTHLEVLAENNLVMANSGETTVKIRIKRERSIVSSLTENDFKATADFEQIYRDAQVPVTIESLNGKISNDDIEQIDFTVGVNLEELKTISKVVEFEQIGKPKDGYSVGEITSNPASVDITCPESMVDYINSVKALVKVDGLAESSVVSAELVIYDGNKKQINLKDTNITIGSNGIVECSVEILNVQSATIVVEVADEDKLAKGHKLSGVEVNPNSILIAGSKEALAELSQIRIKDISVAGLDKDTEKKIDIRSYLPDGVRVAGDSPDIEVKIKVD